MALGVIFDLHLFSLLYMGCAWPCGGIGFVLCSFLVLKKTPKVLCVLVRMPARRPALSVSKEKSASPNNASDTTTGSQY